ncbi:hypothetical protein AB0D38_39150, partial [Streptomyces sp. NPDC048279]|uniref:hypothetical protein n=1 Tax=Streptomyces sp. NPDC048279 TaxID=3154714 RepID=UPI0034423A40
VDAEYAALGVIGPDGRRLSAFLTAGVTEEEIAEAVRSTPKPQAKTAQPPRPLPQEQKRG